MKKLDNNITNLKLASTCIAQAQELGLCSSDSIAQAPKLGLLKLGLLKLGLLKLGLLKLGLCSSSSYQARSTSTALNEYLDKF